jgi:DNA-binding XRE family transcriptional regulator
MQVVAKTRRIDLKMVGDIPERVLSVLKAEYGDLQVTGDDDEELLNVEDTEWFRSMKADMTPGKMLKTYRTRKNLTQEELGRQIGGVPRQHISGMEKGTRPIGREMAKRLAEVLRFDYRKIL